MTYIKLFAIVTISLVLFLSCMGRNNKSTVRCLELVEDVERLQKGLPRQIEDGLVLTRVDYEDSVYTTWYEVDDKKYSFDEMAVLLEKRKKEVIDDASISEGLDRRHYEMYVEYNIRMRLIYSGKTNQKQVEITITPSEIDEALHSNSDAMTKLRMLINSRTPQTSEKVEGIIGQHISLIDSVVYMTIELDENVYDVMSLKSAISSEDIIEELKMINPQIVRYMTEARCDLCYRVIGSKSKTGFDIIISSNEIKEYNL